MIDRSAVYRLYGTDDSLLYVGVSVDPRRRYLEHASTQPWGPEVARFEVAAWYDERRDALAAEAHAIRSDRPRHNLHVPMPDGRVMSLGKKTGLPATGQTPVRNLRVAEEIWRPALAKAGAEGCTLTSVLTDFLREYISTPPRPREGDDD